MADGQDLTPHPLIKRLAAQLVSPNDREVTAAVESGGDGETAAVNVLACKRGLPELTTFSGYLGGTVDQPSIGPGGTVQQPGTDDGPTRWRVMYQDQKAVTWLLVPEKEIVLHDRVEDKNAAFKQRDVIWVKADAPVRQGRRGESEQSMFLVGSFTSAGDLHASLIAGGTFGGASGILCAPTPDCCGKHTG
jgi:hypothetical protein